ncbi:NADP(H)-dependent aldo-keto reductase [Algicola sagamiensis]|uniref:NADP(H)-dependent aldo-keto reductase n=1 Tax=Algicola sagamiensis TaxID=163869 RepID=UPI0003770924|nr:NADP(H)-dependent aldo-keto reductase [Algicola sagamiensis]
MKYKKIPHTSLEVSRICLGTMTFGEQNTEADAHQQLDYALERGVNFIDTAEMYPVPPSPETQGRTEAYIGSWLKNPSKREKMILATKVAGPDGSGVGYIRPEMRYDRRNIQQAVDASLERLQTDYIDLYQIHWPHRSSNYFGKLSYPYEEDLAPTPILETLEALAEQQKAGKIRYIGVSNETAWGVMTYLRYAERHELPRVVTIQNPYSLLNRVYEVSLAEVAHREGVELLAYSPLAFGTLSGKYLNGARPDNARLTLYGRFSRYLGEKAQSATEAYVNLAKNADLDPAQMALAFVNMQPFLASNIIGATTMAQLKTDIDSVDLTLSQDVLDEIDRIHKLYTFPSP